MAVGYFLVNFLLSMCGSLYLIPISKVFQSHGPANGRWRKGNVLSPSRMFVRGMTHAYQLVADAAAEDGDADTEDGAGDTCTGR